MKSKDPISYDHEEYMKYLKEDIAIWYSLDPEEFNILDDFSPEAQKLYSDLLKKIQLKWKFNK